MELQDFLLVFQHWVCLCSDKKQFEDDAIKNQHFTNVR
jgi:hypothetical protein